ncbi:hypothetical protein [Acinetobacter baumannii]
MNFRKASDQQLDVIIKNEYDCSPSLLRGAVLEMLDRGLFDKMIADITHKITCNVKKTEQIHGIGMQDFLQIGRMEVLFSLEKFNPSMKNSFFSFLYLKVRNIIVKTMQHVEYQKRDNRKVSSLNIELDDGTEIIEFINDNKTNVEKYVLNKVMLEQLIKKVNKHQKIVLSYRLQGYQFAEISELLGRGNDRSMYQAYMNAIQKMRKGFTHETKRISGVS